MKNEIANLQADFDTYLDSYCHNMEEGNEEAAMADAYHAGERLDTIRALQWPSQRNQILRNLRFLDLVLSDRPAPEEDTLNSIFGRVYADVDQIDTMSAEKRRQHAELLMLHADWTNGDVSAEVAKSTADQLLDAYDAAE